SHRQRKTRETLYSRELRQDFSTTSFETVSQPDCMEMTFFILVILLAIISTFEYFSGKVLDVAFTKILMRRQETQGKFFKIISAQFVVRIFLLTLIFLTYGIIFKAGFVDPRRVRTYIVLIFILIVFPVATIRKQFSSWVKKTARSGKKNK